MDNGASFEQSHALGVNDPDVCRASGGKADAAQVVAARAGIGAVLAGTQSLFEQE